MRRLWVAGWVFVVLSWVAAVAFGFLGTWALGWRGWASVGVICLYNLPGTIGMATWTADDMPKPLLPKPDRQKLESEQRRIRLESAIKQLERDAGLHD